MVVIGMSEYGSDSLRPGKEKGPDLRVCFDGSGLSIAPRSVERDGEYGREIEPRSSRGWA